MVQAPSPGPGADVVRDRVRRIFEELDEPVDRILIRTATEPMLDLSFFYVTGIDEGLFEDASAVLGPDGDAELIVPRLEQDIADRSGLDVSTYRKQDEHEDQLAKALDGAESIGYNGEGLTVANHRRLGEAAPDAELIDVGSAVRAARLIKDADELDRIEEAADVASEVLAGLADLLRPGVREREVAAEIEYRMRELGASGPAFDTIVAFGPHSAEPHYTTGDGELRRRELALIDFGAVVDRYRSDVTRTFVLGEPTDKQRRMYEVVLEAQQAAIDAIAPGVAMEKVHAAASDVVDASPFEGRFIHSTGHGLGLATHDGGALTDGRSDPLRESMVFTVEPGVYLPGEGGVRIEDDVVVTEDGCRVLTEGAKGVDAFTLDR